MKYFLYARKSTDTEDKQVLSIQSQLNEVRQYGIQQDLEITQEFQEARTAKSPGRPIFDEMIKRIEKGEASGIITWHPDRLARNSIDGGKIIYLVDTEKIIDLKFPTYRFDNSAQGKFMLNIIFGQSKYYVDNLSENTKRGLREKVKLGEYPAFAPIGYLNDKNKITSKRSKKSARINKSKPEVTSNTGQEAIVYSTTSETSDSTTTAIPIIVASIGPTATQSGNGQSTTTTSATESSSVASSTPLASEEISKEEQTEESTQTESSQKYSEFFKPGDHATTSLAVDPYEEVSEIPPGTGKGDDSASQGLLESGAIQAEFYPDELIIFNPETCDVLSSSAPEQFTDLTFGELEISGDPTLHKLNFAIPAPALMEGITEGGELSVVVGIFREEGASYTRLVTLIWRDLPREISSLSTFNFSVSHSRIFVWDHAIRTRVMLWGNTLEACVNPDGLMKFAINVPVGEGLIFPIPDRISGRPDGEVRSVEKTLSLKSYEDKDY